MTADGRDTFVLVRNAVGALAFLLLALYFHGATPPNEAAAVFCLTTAAVIFVYSGRRRHLGPNAPVAGDETT